jgi:hypothetical protein
MVMKKYVSRVAILTIVLVVLLSFSGYAADNYSFFGSSGIIAGTSLEYRDLRFSDDRASVKIRNKGLDVYLSAKMHVIDTRRKIMMEFGPIEGGIPASGTTEFVSRYPYPIINYRPRKGVIYQTVWLDLEVVPKR